MVKDATTALTSASSQGSERLATSLPQVISKQDAQAYWPTIATKDQIPGWLRDNDYIIWGHPMPTYSYRRSFRLWRCLHMETMNIWTHLIGSGAFIAAGITLYNYASNSNSLHVSTGDKFAFGCSIAAATVCFGLSTAFHTLRSHSYTVHHFWGRMDIFGICLFALSGGSSLTYYAFYCRPTTQRVYWGLGLGSSIFAAITLFDTGGGGNKMRALRGGVFTLLAVSAMLPLFHSLGLLGWSRACREIGAMWYLGEGLSLLVGVCLFVGRFPERLSPGSFDIWGHSHQLFHVCSVLAGAFHIAGLVAGYNYRQAHLTC
ncbi:hemolysin-III related-domain-containing protein [Xylogone sp. PMI_703]|nr:hemolysin-III related-domain-containing protein [Xylogone sp. PMI_703]